MRAVDSPSRSESGQSRFARLRLRLALVTMAVAPLALSAVLLRALGGPLDRAEAIGALAIAVALGLLAIGLSAWTWRRIVRLDAELARTRADQRPVPVEARAEGLRDALTGLGNHRAFQEELDHELQQYDRDQVPVALLLLDLDDLRLVNEAAGYGAGDEMLREMGHLIAGVGRFADRAFRIGGDEFAVLMPHTDAEGAVHVGRRLLERAMRPASGSRAMPFSAGVSACPQLAATRSQLYAQAEAALEWCKRHGRASIDVFNPVRDHAADREATDELSAAIVQIVAEQLVRPVYQPIVALDTGRVLGFEGLTRPAPDSGFGDPTSMFEAADAVGRTVELDLACLQAVIGGARQMPADQMLTVNISPRTLEAPHFSADALLAILGRHSIAPQRVVVELTERGKVDDLDRLQANLVALQRAGLRIAADDVGAGTSGLLLLSRMRFDIVKINLSLIHEESESDESLAVLRSVCELAARWQAAVIAERIESLAQLRVVRELGVTAGQGYLLAQPMYQPLLAGLDLNAIAAGGFFLSRAHARTDVPLAAPLAG